MVQPIYSWEKWAVARGVGMDLRHQGVTDSLHSEYGLECGMASENDGYFFYHALDKYTIVSLQLELEWRLRRSNFRHNNIY